MFRSALYRALPDPVDRLLAYVNFRKAILQGTLPESTCLVGPVVQEVYQTHPSVREACDKSIREHGAMLELEITKAMHTHQMIADWTEESVALYMQAVSFLVALGLE